MAVPAHLPIGLRASWGERHRCPAWQHKGLLIQNILDKRPGNCSQRPSGMPPAPQVALLSLCCAAEARYTTDTRTEGVLGHCQVSQLIVGCTPLLPCLHQWQYACGNGHVYRVLQGFGGPVRVTRAVDVCSFNNRCLCSAISQPNNSVAEHCSLRTL